MYHLLSWIAKLANYWDKKVYDVVEKLKGVPVFVVEQESGREWKNKKGKTQTLHRNLLKTVNEVACVIQPSIDVVDSGVSGVQKAERLCL